MHPDEFVIDWKSAYAQADERTAATRRQLPHELDIPYGEDVKQRLDIYRPLDKPQRAPVLIFLHGGGNREGDRAHYGYVAAPLAKHGIMTVVPSYRLQPAFPWPAQRDDAQAAVAWVYRNIARYGGDPQRIYVAGHSAGATLTMILAYRTQWRSAYSLPNDVVKGAVVMSGPWSRINAAVVDPVLRAEFDVLDHVESPPPFNVLSWGGIELEGPDWQVRRHETERLAATLRKAGATARTVFPAGLDHATLVLSMYDEDSEIVAAMLEIFGQAAQRR